MTCIIQGLNSQSSSQSRGQNFRFSREYNTNGQAYFQNGPYPVETTIARHNGEIPNSNSSIATKLHPRTGLQHPYNEIKKLFKQLTGRIQGMFCVR